jgi:hypothetical protein
MTLALGLTLAASIYLAFQPEDDELPAPVAASRRGDSTAARSGVSRPPVSASLAWPTALPARDAASWRPMDVAVASAWGVPPPAPPARPAVAVVASAAEPPPLPYTLIGRIDDGGQAVALLAGPRRTESVKAGDRLDQDWRVEAVQDDGVHLLWLPGRVPQLIGYKNP